MLKNGRFLLSANNIIFLLVFVIVDVEPNQWWRGWWSQWEKVFKKSCENTHILIFQKQL